MTEKRLVATGDWHVGHKLAVAPPNAEIPQEDADPTSLELNKVQKALYGAFSELAKDWHKPDYLVINGEPIEGQQPKNMGTEVWTTDISAQLDAAVTLAKMFDAKEVFVLRGSDYHTTLKGTNLDDEFGRRIEASRIRGRYSAYELFLKIDEVTFHFSHHIQGTGSMMYRGTAPTKEMMLMQLVQSRKYDADVIVRSHIHYYWETGASSHRAFVLPCFKLQDWFSYRRSAGASVPDIGAVQFTIEGEEYDWEPRIFKLDSFKPPRIER